MTAPPTKKVILNCRAKNRYSDEVGARAGALWSLSHNTDLQRLYVYKCPCCNGWHVTRKKNTRMVSRKELECVK